MRRRRGGEERGVERRQHTDIHGEERTAVCRCRGRGG
jgi:hypothetical protein